MGANSEFKKKGGTFRLDSTKYHFCETLFNPRIIKKKIRKTVIFIYNYFSCDLDCELIILLTSIFFQSGIGINSGGKGDNGYPLNSRILRPMIIQIQHT